MPVPLGRYGIKSVTELSPLRQFRFFVVRWNKTNAKAENDKVLKIRNVCGLGKVL